MEARECYERWMTDPYFDKDTRRELQEIEGHEEEIGERFGKELEFGTGGLRGIIGAGTNRMNRYVVRKATQGLADYIKEQNKQDKGVAIAYDSRSLLRPELPLQEPVPPTGARSSPGSHTDPTASASRSDSFRRLRRPSSDQLEPPSP